MTELTLSCALARKREPRRESLLFRLPPTTRVSTRVLPLSFLSLRTKAGAYYDPRGGRLAWTFAFALYDTVLRISQSQLYARPSVPFFVPILSFSLAELLRFKKLLSRLSLSCLTTERKETKKKETRLSFNPLFFILLLTLFLSTRARVRFR